jgi:inorganic pyrophosphatase
MQHFFKVYKQLENKETDIRTLYGRDEALRIIGEAIAAYHEKYVTPNLGDDE